MRKLLTAKEVADLLGIADATLYSWINRGHGPPTVKLPSGSIRFRAESLEAWIAGVERKSHRGRRGTER